MHALCHMPCPLCNLLLLMKVIGLVGAIVPFSVGAMETCTPPRANQPPLVWAEWGKHWHTQMSDDLDQYVRLIYESPST